MKISKLLAATAAALTFSTALPIQTNAGLIALLRGDEENAHPFYQRIAFVGTAEVKEVRGTVVRLEGIDSWTPLRKGMALSAGEIIRSENGTVVLRMTESQSLVKVTPHTIFRLAPMEVNLGRKIAAVTTR
jgi:hypothetical protein